jgi:enterochelin esterase family protein
MSSAFRAIPVAAFLSTLLAFLPPARGPEPAAGGAPPVPAGHVEEFRIDSKIYGRERRVWVYTPPGYSADAASACDLLIAFDGGEYLEEIPLPRMLDALLAERRAGPFVAVLIDNGSSAERLADLANHARFADFVADELVEWTRRKWRVTRDPRRTIVTGSSAGGLAAAYVALQHPEVCGNVLSQSGALWRGNEGSNGAPYEWLTTQYATTPRRDVRFVLEAGSLESAGAMGGAAPSILEANRRLRDVLLAKGYPVTYAEVPDAGHAPEYWRRRLPDAIATLARFPEK